MNGVPVGQNGSGDPTDVFVARSPLQSMHQLLHDVVNPPGAALAPAATRALRSALSSDSDAFALSAFRCDGGGLVPEATAPIPPRGDVTVAEQVRCLHDYPPDELTADLAGIGPTSGAWRRIGDEPRRWLSAYAATTATAWRLLEPWWHTVGPLIDRETERIGIAAVRGGLDTVLNTLSRRITFADGTFHVARSGAFPLRGRRIVLVPSILGPDGLFIHLDEPDVLSIAYPVRGVLSPPPPAPHRTDRLATVLGAARAAILRRLDAPVTMGTVAARLSVTPAAATRHCDLLDRAGLITRRRRGQVVLVSRSDTADRLLQLLG